MYIDDTDGSPSDGPPKPFVYRHMVASSDYKHLTSWGLQQILHGTKFINWSLFYSTLHMLLDPLLRKLQLDLWMKNYFSHVDDIRTLASGEDTMDSQIKLVREFAAESFLKLNAGLGNVR